MATTFPSQAEAARKWVLVDATGQVLGRMATRIAIILRGKDKPSFTPFLDTGDFVVVVNAEKVVVTGRKLEQVHHERYSGYPGGRTTQPLGKVMQTHPDRAIREAVKGMLPDGPLGRQMLGKLKIYAGSTHPHAAQQPTPSTVAVVRQRKAKTTSKGS
jgi:large subunit ribosomal protein L13